MQDLLNKQNQQVSSPAVVAFKKRPKKRKGLDDNKVNDEFGIMDDTRDNFRQYHNVLDE